MKDQVKASTNLKLAVSIAKYKSFSKKLVPWEINFLHKDSIKIAFEVFALAKFWNLIWDLLTDLLWHCPQCQKRHNNIDLCYLLTVSKWFFRLGATFQALFWLIFLSGLFIYQFEKQRMNKIWRKTLFSSHSYTSDKSDYPIKQR